MATLLDCIQRIPTCLMDIRREYPERAKHISEFLAGKGMKKADRLVFIASGSSYNSAHAARLFIKNQCGIQVELKYPNMFVLHEADRELTETGNDAVIYVVISQGGETKLAYRALEMIKAAGKPCIAVTSHPGTSIARLADFHVDMGCGQEEFMYRTIGFSASAAVCCLLGLAIGVYNKEVAAEKEAGYLQDFDAMADNLGAMEQTAEAWYQSHKFSILRRNNLLIAGTGNLYPIANEGDIKLMEMVPMMTRSFELEEFIHGPQNSFHDSTLFLLLVRKGEDEEKAKSIARFIKERIGFCALVGDDVLDETDLRLSPASSYFFGLEYVTVFQVLAYRMADDRGRDLSRGIHTAINQYITKTL